MDGLSMLFDCVMLLAAKKMTSRVELARTRTWNLLIRSQTRYPLRHKPLAYRSSIPYTMHTNPACTLTPVET